MSVLIVGAGPAGAALSLLLASRGVAVTLVERERDFERVFRGEGLMPSGVDALRTLGLGPLLERLPGRPLEAWEMYVDGRETLVVPEPVEKLGARAMRIVPQPALLEGMIEEASKSPSFRFEPGTSVRDLLLEEGRVVGLRVRSGDETKELRGALVVGCDGRASMVRKRAGIELDEIDQNYDVLWFKLPAPERLRGSCRFQMMAHGGAGAACYTSWDERLQYAFAIRKGSYAELRSSLRGSDWAELLAEGAPPWLADHVLSVRDRIEGPVVLDVVVGRAAPWSAPGLFLMGDAAHPMSPIRAQGINLALRDAIVAANHLVPVLRKGADPAAIDAASRAIQAEREPEIKRSQILQHRDSRFWFTPVAPMAMALARTLGPLLGKGEWAKRAWLDQQRDLRFGSADVELRV